MTSIRHTRDVFYGRQWRPFGVRGLSVQVSILKFILVLK